MPRTRNPYPAEFRDHIIALARSGRSIESLAREFEPCVATIHAWVKQSDRGRFQRAQQVRASVLASAGAHAQVPCG